MGSRADIPPQCFSNNNAEREAARSKFRRVQKHKLAEQGRIPLNYLWRADGLGVEWKKAGGEESGETTGKGAGGGKRRKIDSNAIAISGRGNLSTAAIGQEEGGPVSASTPVEWADARTSPVSNGFGQGDRGPSVLAGKPVTGTATPASATGGPTVLATVAAAPPTLPQVPASQPTRAPAPAAVQPTPTPTPAISDLPAPPPPSTHSRNFDIPAHLSLQDLESRVLQGIMEIDTWTSLLEDYPQQRTRLSRQVERKQEEIFALTGLIRQKRVEGG